MRACARAAPIQQSARLGLQPPKPRSRFARRSSAPSLALCVSIHAERPGLCRGVGLGRWLALSIAPPDRHARCAEDDSLLHWPPTCQTNTPHLVASALQYKIQRTSTRRLFLRSGLRAPIGLHRLGDSQTHAASLVDGDLRWL